MKLLLDTHAVIWWVWDDPQLSERALETIGSPENRKLVSVASCWEIAIKVSIGKLRLGQPSDEFLARQLHENGFELLPILLEEAAAVENLPFHHRDPFDRLLVCQALHGGFPIVSADVSLDACGVSRIW